MPGNSRVRNHDRLRSQKIRVTVDITHWENLPAIDLYLSCSCEKISVLLSIRESGAKRQNTNPRYSVLWMKGNEGGWRLHCPRVIQHSTVSSVSFGIIGGSIQIASRRVLYETWVFRWSANTWRLTIYGELFQQRRLLRYGLQNLRVNLWWRLRSLTFSNTADSFNFI